MMQGQRQGPYIAGHPMAMGPRSMRPTRAIYSSSPQGHSPMQGYIQQQNMQYQVVGQVGLNQYYTSNYNILKRKRQKLGYT